MSQGMRGRSLENAVRRQARAYAKDGRCLLFKPPTPTFTDGNGNVRFAGKAGVDFAGCHRGGQALFLECKETSGKALPIEKISDYQVRLMSELHDLGSDVRLIVSFDSVGEAFAIKWPSVRNFIDAPWRESLSLAWCRSRGWLLPETDPDDSERRCVHFLDGEAHPQAQEALEESHRDEDACRARIAEEIRAEQAETSPQAISQGTMADYQARIMDAVAEGIRRQSKRKPRTYARRGKA